MLKKLLNTKTKSITSAAIIVGAASLISRILGILRDRVLAGEFGAGYELDIYYASFRIPDLIFNLLVLGAISAGFIPIFVSYLKRGKVKEILGFKSQKKAWQVANLVLNSLIVCMIVATIILIIFAPILVRLIAPGFTDEQLDLTANLTRIMFLSPILLGISAIIGGILQSFKRFFVYSLAPIFYNIGIIIGALYLVDYFGIYGLAWGVVLGAFLHLAIQVPATYNLGYRYTWILDFKDKGLRRIIKMMVPRTLSLGITQINLLVITIIASTLAVGSITVFNFANNLQSFPLGIFGISFAIAAFPTLAELASKKNLDKFIESFSSTFRQILFLVIPSSVLLLILRAQIVRIVLGTGRFDWEDTVMTLNTLGFFALSLFAQSLIPLLARAFYSFHDSKTPFLTGLFSAVVNIILSLLFIKRYDVAGLALAFSISSILNFVLLIIFLRFQTKKLDGINISLTLGKVLLASGFLAILTQSVKYAVEPITGTQTFLGIATQGFLACVVGLAGYVFILWWLKSDELSYFTKMFKKKFFKIKTPVDASEAR
ncbi:murein biosynthesis integral membrane protein MurJ [Patescibacteria group bacterium]|nr:murein biosynthesis integral membrane protein MurJ [Patescibacteria group bacterium]